MFSVATAAPEQDWVAPDAQSHADGPYGVMFVPRYTPAQADRGPQRDVRRLLEAAADMDEAGRREAALRLRDRHEVVATWRGRFTDKIDEVGGLHLQEDLGDAWLSLVVEEATLELQLSLLDHAPAGEADLTAAMILGGDDDGDLVQFGETVVVPDQVTVHDAVAFGADVVVEGRVLSDAISFGGDVHVRPGAVVLGDVVAFGGTTRIDETAHVGRRHLSFNTPADAFGSVRRSRDVAEGPSPWARFRGLLVSWMSLAGAGLLTLGMFPTHVDSVARVVDRRPMASMAMGFGGSALALLAAVLFAFTLIGIPVSLLLLAGMGLAGLLGFVGVCQAVGDRLPMRVSHHGRWIVFLGATLALTLFSTLPVVGVLGVLGALSIGTGAALLSRFGRV
jgi:hypothetical protein